MESTQNNPFQQVQILELNQALSNVLDNFDSYEIEDACKLLEDAKEVIRTSYSESYGENVKPLFSSL